MTSQPALDDPFFEMEDAYRWFNKRYSKADAADLMGLSALDPPPGYADLQEQRLRKPSKDVAWQSAEWSHFRIYRDGGPPTLAVVLGMRSYVLVAESTGKHSGELYSMWAVLPSVAWRVWLYEHRRGWVCLDPRDDSHEVVRNLREQMILEALK